MSPAIKALETYLANWSHIKIGSWCKNFFLPEDSHQLSQAMLYAVDNSLSIVPLAAGSNLLMGDTSRSALISDHRLPVYWKKAADKIIVSGNYNITRLIMELARLGFGGLEFLAGIPAHISGLVKMNAGAYGKQISDFIYSVTLLDRSGKKYHLSADQIVFDYRYSSLNDYIIEIMLIPYKKTEKKILREIKENIELRRIKQPLHLPNLGSIFKNPAQKPAGYLLEKAGLKGMSFGEAAFSSMHANFLINLGNATFSDAITLINYAQNKVQKDFGIELKLEIEVIDL